MYRFSVCFLLFAVATPVAAQPAEFDQEPINYKTARDDNAVSVLRSELEAGRTLDFKDDHGYLPALLDALEIPRSSQVLVFSKTSLQRDRIAPGTPRAIYFNDDVYIGYCHRGEKLEVSTADTNLGTAFYTLDQEPVAKPRFTREPERCLACHATAATGGVPGHLVRSVFTDRSGLPILSAGSFRTDHTSPFEERWGGWYVTGTHGKQAHMGNWIAKNRKDPRSEGNADGQNVTDLTSRFDGANYLTPHSDIVALMVLEHQIECHNRIASAMIATRQAHHYETTLNESLGEPADKRWDSAVRRIESAGERLAQYLLFSGEARLEAPVTGTSGFAKEFAARGPFDKQGRSLRQFDLRTRLFKYPCSYLIYSKSFAELPTDVKDDTLKRIHDVLTGEDQSETFAHLTATDRTAILEILRDTLPDLPEYWKK